MKCPPNTICIDKKGLYILLIICTFVIYYIYQYFNNKNDYISSLNNNLIEQQTKLNDRIEKKLLEEDKRVLEIEKNREENKRVLEIERNREENIIKTNPGIVNQYYDRLYNPLVPPLRSPSNSSVYGINFPGVGVPINIPTRGWAPDFQQIGILSSDTYKSILPLFGRRMHNGGNKWWYYTMSDQNNSLKLPIKHKNRDCQDDFGCDEVSDGDIVSVPIINSDFKVNLYNFDKPRYIPFI